MHVKKYFCSFRIPLNKYKAKRKIDTFIKILYERVFKYVVEKLNGSRNGQQNTLKIIIMDIAGFGKTECKQKKNMKYKEFINSTFDFSRMFAKYIKLI